MILRQLPLSLGQLDLEWSGIDFRQQIAGFHLLPFGKVQGHQLAVDPAGDGNGIGGGDGAQPDQIARHGLLRGRGHLNRRQIAAAFATGGRSFGTAGRAGSRLCFSGRRRGVEMTPNQHGDNGHDGGNQQAQHQGTTLGFCIHGGENSLQRTTVRARIATKVTLLTEY